MISNASSLPPFSFPVRLRPSRFPPSTPSSHGTHWKIYRGTLPVCRKNKSKEGAKEERSLYSPRSSRSLAFTSLSVYIYIFPSSIVLSILVFALITTSDPIPRLFLQASPITQPRYRSCSRFRFLRPIVFVLLPLASASLPFSNKKYILGNETSNGRTMFSNLERKGCVCVCVETRRMFSCLTRRGRSVLRHVPVRSHCEQFMGIREHGRVRRLPSRPFVVVRGTSVVPTPATAAPATAPVVLLVGVFRGRRVYEHADGARFDGGVHRRFRHRCRIHGAAGCVLSCLVP